MKATASNLSHRSFHQLCQRMALARILGDAYGAGSMSDDYKRRIRQAGWTPEQLLAMAAAKSGFN